MKRKPTTIRELVHHGVKPNRAAANLKVRNSNVRAGGCTTFKKRKVVEIQAPLVSGAYARTIRIHELLHANNSQPPRKSKFPELAVQAIEDARVHSVYWPQSMPRKANRDCLAAALADMRTIRPMAELKTAEQWNRTLLIALRVMSIFNRLNDSTSKRAYRNREQLKRRLLNAFGDIITEKLEEILGKVRTRKGIATKEFAALMREDDEEQPDGSAGYGSHGKATDSAMRIIRLPMLQACNSAIRRTSFARSGCRLNRGRLVRAVATGSTNGLFIRTRYLAGGTYLFDASGSMNLSDDRLNELCRAVPAAQVAYYSGGNGPDETGCYGELVIYAANGRRAAECTNVWGGNEVDLFALQWLLKQPAPRVYIGDGQFCGGPVNQDVKAAALLIAAVANVEIVWHRSIYSLEKSLGLCK